MGATQSDAIFSQLHLIIMIIMTACLFCLQTRFIQPTLSAAQEHMMGNPSLPASLTNYSCKDRNMRHAQKLCTPLIMFRPR